MLPAEVMVWACPDVVRPSSWLIAPYEEWKGENPTVINKSLQPNFWFQTPDGGSYKMFFWRILKF